MTYFLRGRSRSLNPSVIYFIERAGYEPRPQSVQFCMEGGAAELSNVVLIWYIRRERGPTPVCAVRMEKVRNILAPVIAYLIAAVAKPAKSAGYFA